MMIISNQNTILAKFPFTSAMLLIDEKEYLNQYVFVAFDPELTPHKKLQKLYEFIAKQCGDTAWFIKGNEERYVGLFIPCNHSGIINLNEILCYAYRFYQNKDNLLNFESIILNYPEYNINIELEPIEQLELASLFINVKIDLSHVILNEKK